MNLSILFALILLVAVAIGMIRVFLGPTTADRMISAQLFGSCGLAILLLLYRGLNAPVLLDVALVFALLAALATMTFVRRAWNE